MKYAVASFSKTGPRPKNEDAIGIWRSETRVGVAVADGLGGMGGGERASQLAIHEFKDFVSFHPAPTVSDLKALALQIHKKIKDEQRAGSFREMATTLSAGIFYGDRLIAVHCGDSRISLARGAGIKRLTRDHSEAQRLLEAGKLTKVEYADYPRKNILESALGINGTPSIDTLNYDIKEGDRFFFTSDGVHNIVLLRELQMLAREFVEPTDMVQQVERMIDKRGAEDNFSMIAVYAESQFADLMS